MTGNPLRPEEERSLHEAHPEVDVPPRPNSPHDLAQALVTRWEMEIALRMPNAVPVADAYIVFTNDIRDRMAADIAAIINETISREHLQP